MQPHGERSTGFGRTMYRRATGELPEMECARSLANVLRELYRPGMKVLDVGCGAGHYLRSLRARVDEDIDYRGVDCNAGYVELARKAFDNLDRFEVADAAALPFGETAFDIVFASNVLPNLPPPPTSALAELLRVAKRHVVVRTLFAPLDYVVVEFAPQAGAAHGFDPSRGLYNNMYSEESYRAMLHEIDPSLEIDVRPDTDWSTLDDGEDKGPWRTRVVAGMQVSGPLVLDWRFLIASRGRHA